jgi:hypothetical protein
MGNFHGDGDFLMGKLSGTIRNEPWIIIIEMYGKYKSWENHGDHHLDSGIRLHGLLGTKQFATSYQPKG